MKNKSKLLLEDKYRKLEPIPSWYKKSDAALILYDVTKENGEKSIIVINNNTYIPNKGILYKNDKKFI